MPAMYVDHVQKLDIRSMMAAAFKASPGDHYTVYRDGSGWHAAAENQAVQQAQELVARIKLDRPPAKGAARPSRGQVLVTWVQPDGRSCEQALWLVAVPTKSRHSRWITLCPYNRQPTQTLYFSVSAQQFVSRQSAGLKYRRKLRKVRNYRARMFAIMRELEATHRGPAIPKPIWMAEALYQDLMQELVEMDLRWMCAALKQPKPRFWGEPFDYANAKPERVNYPPSTVLFYAKKGVRQLKAKYRKRYGLPAAAA
jgi:hypothetical protein